MSKNKYNIEEVFKSELEDFEIEIPKNGWSNLSNNITSTAKVAKTSFWNSTAFTITTIGTSLVIATGAIIYSNTSSNNKKTNIAANKIIKTDVITQLKETKLDNENTTSLLEEITTNEEETLDPVIEETKKEKTRSSKQYIIKNTTSDNETNKDYEVESTLTEINKKPIKPINTSQNNDTKDIEIIEIEATEIVASISASPIGGYAPLTVDFSHHNENVFTVWDFKDGNNSKEIKPTHTFEKEGQYEVELTLTDNNGITKHSTKTINVLATSKLNKIPNIFTPNEDGINDKFIVAHENIESFDLYIYNKSGELVFNTNNIDKGWNGNTNYDEKAAAGNYIFKIKAKGIDGKDFEESGIIKLAR